MSERKCGYEYRGETCAERGDHWCELRGDKVVNFFTHVLKHHSGVLAGQPFILRDWQESEIIRPIFSEVVWSDFASDYIRKYKLCWIEMGRKNGKSSIIAGVMLYLLMSDGEQAGQNICAAKTRDQASILFNQAKLMVQASPVLSKKLRIIAASKTITHDESNSYLRVISRDADSALGMSPSGVAFDEVVAQPDGDLFDSLNSGMGARKQPLMICITTPGTDVESFAGQMHKEMLKVKEDPTRSPHIFVYMLNTPIEADWRDPETWKIANPGLGIYLSEEEMRQQANEAMNNPGREVTFRTLRLSTWMNVSSRWMPMQVYDAAQGEEWKKPDFNRTVLEGLPAFAGLDLAATSDLTSWCIAVPREGKVHLLWRHWISQDALDKLDEKTDRSFTRWAEQGWITVNDGNVVDYSNVYAEIERDLQDFNVLEVDYDPWGAASVIQELESRANRETQFVKIPQHYAQMTPNLTALMTNMQSLKVEHHGNPVARFCFDSVEVKYNRENPDLYLPVKPERGKEGKRIDAVLSSAMAIGAYALRGEDALKPRGPKGSTKGKRAAAW